MVRLAVSKAVEAASPQIAAGWQGASNCNKNVTCDETFAGDGQAWLFGKGKGIAMKNAVLFEIRNVLVVHLMLTFCAINAGAQTVVVNSLVSFNGVNNGDHPYAGLTLAGDGNFYGTTEDGGSSNYGTVFKMTPGGTLTTLVSFAGTNGEYPVSGLTLGNDGKLYGTTYQGGSNNDGTVFQITTNGTLASLVSFTGSNGASPYAAGLVLGSDGNLYGTTEYGGSNNDGTVFRMTTSGILTSLASFAGTNGANPQAGLALGSDGNFYGTTVSGGSNSYGAVFKVATNGGLSLLASFNNTNGANPWGWLTLGSDGNFYGTTVNGGTGSLPYGTVFRVSTNGLLASLFTFDFDTGKGPYAGLTPGSDGNLYGTTTYGGTNSGSPGTLFEVNTNGTVTTLFNFSFIGNDGGNPFGGLTRGVNGNYYGTAWQGGQYGEGAIFVVSFPVVVQTSSVSSNRFSISFPTVDGQSYTIQQISALAENDWSTYTNLTGSGFSAQITIPATNGPAQFFRVVQP
jgi:uncharacterized repeat protein (TIGR03803 family)